jgi:hypothetical protein
MEEVARVDENVIVAFDCVFDDAFESTQEVASPFV